MSEEYQKAKIRIYMEIVGAYAEVRVFSDPKLLKETDRQYLMENLGVIKRAIHSLSMGPEEEGESPLLTNANIETRKIHNSKGCLCKKKPESKNLPDNILQHSELEGI